MSNNTGKISIIIDQQLQIFLVAFHVGGRYFKYCAHYLNISYISWVRFLERDKTDVWQF